MNAMHRRGHPLRLALFAVGGIAVLGVAASVVVAAALDPAKLRDTLQDAVLRSTGRTLTVSGGVHLRFGLSPEFEVDGIALSNLDGTSRPQMLTAKSVRANLALLPLMGGDAVISALTLVGPDIVLERAADGTPNWQFTPPRRTLYQGHSAQPSNGTHHRVEIRRIDIAGGTMSWLPHQGQPRRFGIDHLTLSAASDDAPMSLDFAGSYDGPAGALPFTLTGSSGSFQRLQGGPVSALAGAWPLTLQLNIQGADLHVEGGFTHPDQVRSYQFRLTGHAADLSVLNAFLAKPYVPPLAGVNFTALLSDGSQGELRTSQLSIHTEASDLGRVVPGLSVKQLLFSAPGPGQLAQLSVDGSYADQPMRLAAAVMQPDIVAAGAPVQLTISAQAAGATLSAHGTLPPSMDSSGLDVQVEAKAPDLSTLSALVHESLPAAHGFALSAELEDAGVKLHGITVRNLMVTSSMGDVAGQFTANWYPRPAIAGTLASRMLDLDTIAAGAPGEILPAIWPPPAGGGPSVQVQMPQPDAQSPSQPPPVIPSLTLAARHFTLPLAFLRANDADVSLTIGDLTAWGQHYHDVAAHLELVDGKLALNPFRAEAPEGAIIGGASIDASSDEPPVAVTLRTPSISAGAVAGLFGYPGQASGTMQVDAELSGVGQTEAALEASLNGRLGLAMVNGKVDNALVQAAIGDALQTQGVPSLGDGSSQVRCFALRMDFAGGVGKLRALAADTSRLTLSGDGIVNLNAGTADLHLRPQVRLGPTSVSSPVSLAGPFGALRASLDPAFGNGRVGIEIGGGGGSGCTDKLALARNGLGGPLPSAAPPADTGLTIKIKKPKDLLRGLFH